MFSSDPSAARAIIAGRMAEAGEETLAGLSLSGGALGGAGALALGPHRLWLAQPQLIGAPAVASVPRSDVRSASFRARAGFLGGFQLRLAVGERVVTLTTQAAREDVEEFVRQVEGGGPGVPG